MSIHQVIGPGQDEHNVGFGLLDRGIDDRREACGSTVRIDRRVRPDGVAGVALVVGVTTGARPASLRSDKVERNSALVHRDHDRAPVTVDPCCERSAEGHQRGGGTRPWLSSDGGHWLNFLRGRNGAERDGLGDKGCVGPLDMTARSEVERIDDHGKGDERYPDHQCRVEGAADRPKAHDPRLPSRAEQRFTLSGEKRAVQGHSAIQLCDARPMTPRFVAPMVLLAAGLVIAATSALGAVTPPLPTTRPAVVVPSSVPFAALKGLRLEPVATGLAEPIEVVSSPDGGLLFVVERTGTVRIAQGGKLLKVPFANLRTQIKSSSIEQGLLGMAFHPGFPQDRRVFFFHSKKDNDNVLVSYLVASDGRSIIAASRVELLTIDKEPDAVRHNAGALRFAPDGLLYVSVGDAARASKNGQNPKTLPGSILRLDVSDPDRYQIPSGNPFADGRAGRPEVFWFGFRNPWRFSIDPVSRLAYIGDVGQEKWEEVSVVPYEQPGLNFGWPLFEGTKRYLKGTPATAVVAPVITVKHGGENGSCSMTGGEVYRGSAIPELVGHYFYADWCLGWIRSFRYDGAAAVDQRDWSQQLPAEMVSAFGHDAAGELLVVDYAGGTVSRVVARR